MSEIKRCRALFDEHFKHTFDYIDRASTEQLSQLPVDRLIRTAPMRCKLRATIDSDT